MPSFTDFKVRALPAVGLPNARYYVINVVDHVVEEFLTDKYGGFHRVNGLAGGTTATEEVNEILIGNIDGSNAIFTTTYPFDASSLIIWINGIKQNKPAHYNNSGNNIIFSESPQVGDVLEINYRKS